MAFPMHYCNELKPGDVIVDHNYTYLIISIERNRVVWMNEADVEQVKILSEVYAHPFASGILLRKEAE